MATVRAYVLTTKSSERMIPLRRNLGRQLAGMDVTEIVGLRPEELTLTEGDHGTVRLAGRDMTLGSLGVRVEGDAAVTVLPQHSDPMSLSEIAVALSHLQVWCRAATDGASHALIAEDRVWFTEGFVERQLKPCLDQLEYLSQQGLQYNVCYLYTTPLSNIEGRQRVETTLQLRTVDEEFDRCYACVPQSAKQTGVLDTVGDGNLVLVCCLFSQAALKSLITQSTVRRPVDWFVKSLPRNYRWIPLRGEAVWRLKSWPSTNPKGFPSAFVRPIVDLRENRETVALLDIPVTERGIAHTVYGVPIKLFVAAPGHRYLPATNDSPSPTEPLLNAVVEGNMLKWVDVWDGHHRLRAHLNKIEEATLRDFGTPCIILVNGYNSEKNEYWDHWIPRWSLILAEESLFREFLDPACVVNDSKARTDTVTDHRAQFQGSVRQRSNVELGSRTQLRQIRLEPEHLVPTGRLYLFFGTFDPIHNGHIDMARFVLERDEAAHVLFIPNAETANKHPTDLRQREQWLESVCIDLTQIFGLRVKVLCGNSALRGDEKYRRDLMWALAEEYRIRFEDVWLMGGGEGAESGQLAGLNVLALHRNQPSSTGFVNRWHLSSTLIRHWLTSLTEQGFVEVRSLLEAALPPCLWSALIYSSTADLVCEGVSKKSPKELHMLGSAIPPTNAPKGTNAEAFQIAK